MSKGKRSTSIKMISIDRINILNPRARNKKAFEDIADNMVRVGLKRPITVTPCRSGASGKDYDLVCGQGRVEAFMACNQTTIPAIIIEASEEEALIMSLVENLARRHHCALDLMQGIGILKSQGYDVKTIAAKTGLSTDYAGGILNLMERGEERLLAGVEVGHIPIRVAIQVAEAPGEEQKALREAYESKQLRGNRLLMAKRLLATRHRHGKTFAKDGRPPRPSGPTRVTVHDVLKVYQREVDRKRLLARKAELVGNKLTFVTEALRRLLKEEHFNNLLRAEGLTTLPKPIVALVEQKGAAHA